MVQVHYPRPFYAFIIIMLDNTNIDRFFKKVNFTDECWNWIGGKSSKKYGRFRINKKLYLPHRLSYKYFYETSIPLKMDVCHHCDNPKCINPGHLFIGTRSDNMKDCVLKNRLNVPKGEKHPHSKLTEEKIREIRNLSNKGYSQRQLSRIYQIGHRAIGAVVNKKSWKHVI